MNDPLEKLLKKRSFRATAKKATLSTGVMH